MYRIFRSQNRWPEFVESFETLSDRYRTSNCEDNRDRVFALLSISQEVVLDRPFTVDYQKSVEETFFSLMAWGATGPIETQSRLKFGILAGEVMDLRYGSYIVESQMDRFDSEKSPVFSKWTSQRPERSPEFFK
jgi:hypothetical protein